MAFFLGGLDKTNVLKHLHRISFLMIRSSILMLHAQLYPSALVPYHSESQLNILAPQAIPDMEDRIYSH